MANKMTTCKTCGTEVAKSATTCPKCGAVLKKKRHPILGILLFIIGLAIIGSALGRGSNQPRKVDNSTSSASANQSNGNVEKATTTTPAPTEAPTATPQDKFEVGDRVELNNIVVTLLGVTESKGSTYNKPTDGNIFVLCEFEIENNSSSEISVSSMMSFNAYCDDYTLTYSLGAIMEKGNKNQLDGQVASGKKFKGVVGYEVPKDWKELEIHFTPNFWSGKDIKFVAKH